MDTLQAIASRTSIRAYRKDPISPETVLRILEAARAAPSAGNRQAREIIVVEDSCAKSALAEAALGQDFIKEAPVNLVFCANPERSAQRYSERGSNLYCILDAAASIENSLLAAHALGLGACWIGAFNDDQVRIALGLPASLRPVAIIPIGYPAEQPEPTPRLRLIDFTHQDHYGQRWREKP
jgi:nitroreductase